VEASRARDFRTRSTSSQEPAGVAGHRRPTVSGLRGDARSGVLRLHRRASRREEPVRANLDPPELPDRPRMRTGNVTPRPSSVDVLRSPFAPRPSFLPLSGVLRSHTRRPIRRGQEPHLLSCRSCSRAPRPMSIEDVAATNRRGWFQLYWVSTGRFARVSSKARRRRLRRARRPLDTLTARVRPARPS